jgi:hypothetical protein
MSEPNYGSGRKPCTAQPSIHLSGVAMKFALVALIV